jgi:hypothetical protein
MREWALPIKTVVSVSILSKMIRHNVIDMTAVVDLEYDIINRKLYSLFFPIELRHPHSHTTQSRDRILLIYSLSVDGDTLDEEKDMDSPVGCCFTISCFSLHHLLFKVDC